MKAFWKTAERKSSLFPVIPEKSACGPKGTEIPETVKWGYSLVA
jgi:hypothetical protein